MKLIINLKPVSIKETRHKGEGTFYTLNKFGSGYTNNIKDHFVGLHSEKRRRKWTGKYKVLAGKKVRIYEPAKWIISKYQISYELLQILNVRFVQRSRHFEFVRNK